jgi:hypothetical protein
VGMVVAWRKLTLRRAKSAGGRPAGGHDFVQRNMVVEATE